MDKIYIITDKFGNEFSYENLKEGCDELDLTPRLLRYTEERLKGTGKRYQEYHKGHKLEIIEDNKKETNLKTAVLIGDLHFKYENKDAVDILYQVLEDYRDTIDEYIDGGDGINNNSLSKFKDVEVETYTLIEEMESYVEHMNIIKDILPESKMTIIEDNHYHLRKKRFLADFPELRGLLKEIDFEFDERVPHAVLYYPFEQDRVGVIHGVRTNKYVCANTLLGYQSDVIHFHTHTAQMHTAKDGQIAHNTYPRKGWAIPSMCIQMEYTNGRPTRQNTGFAFLTYDKSTDNYSIEYIFVENGEAIFRGKKYISEYIEERE